MVLKPGLEFKSESQVHSGCAGGGEALALGLENGGPYHVLPFELSC